LEAASANEMQERIAKILTNCRKCSDEPDSVQHGRDAAEGGRRNSRLQRGSSEVACLHGPKKLKDRLKEYL